LAALGDCRGGEEKNPTRKDEAAGHKRRRSGSSEPLLYPAAGLALSAYGVCAGGVRGGKIA